MYLQFYTTVHVNQLIVAICGKIFKDGEDKMELQLIPFLSQIVLCLVKKLDHV